MRLLTLLALRRASEAAPSLASLEGELAAVERALAQRVPGRDVALARRLGLGPVELELLWLAVAVTADPLLGPHAVALAGAEARRGATLAFFAAITDLSPARLQGLAVSLRPSHPLLRSGLLEPAGADHVSAMTAYRAAPRLVAHLGGDDALDEALQAVPMTDEVSFDAVAEEGRRRVAAALASEDPVFIVIRGREGSGRRTLAAHAAREVGRRVAVLDLERRPSTVAALEPALVALHREHLLTGALPVLAGLGDLTPERDGQTRGRLLEGFIDSFPGPVVAVASASDGDLHPRRPIVCVDRPIPGASARRELWRKSIGSNGADLDGLAMRYRIAPSDVTRAVGTARVSARARGAETPTTREIIEGVRATVRQSLCGLAERIEVRESWEDLVVPDDIRAQLGDLIARVRDAYQVLEEWRFRNLVARGGGIAALFRGAPGTGKTMAAGLVARALDLDLYQVDVSAVVSKWIGETEKNLSRLFEAADAGHALLLFDEADSLFAKRTEVRGSNDRHANLEVNHLLTRIEAFGGLAILTTNMDASLDPALRRRLAASIEFSPPDEAERESLWKRMLGGRAPLAGDVDPAQLARRFSALTGATIRNAVVTAAFRAASAGSGITQALLQRAAADEYQTIGRIFREEKDR